MDMGLGFELNYPKSNRGDSPRYDVIVVGGGPAGVTTAIYTARAGLRTLVVDKGLTAGALGLTGKIANYPGIPEEVTGAELVERMRAQASSFGAEFITDHVVGADLQTEEKLLFGNNGTYAARAVVIASGSMNREKHIKGEQEMIGHGVSYCATCDAAFFRGQEVAVAGSTDEAIEEALYLSRFVAQVHFLCPTPELKAPPGLVAELMANIKVKYYPGASLREVIGSQHVEAVRFGQRSGGELVLPVSGVFIYLQGNLPATDFIADQLKIGESGCLVVNANFETNLPGVFAVGDVLCNHIKQAVVAAGEGAVAGMAVEKALHNRKQMGIDWAK